MGKKELDKETALRRFNKGKKHFEKTIASNILQRLVSLEKHLFEETGQEMTGIEKDAAIRDFYKHVIEIYDKKIGVSPRNIEILPIEDMHNHLLDDLVAERIYKKIEKLRPKYIKKLQIKERNEHIKKEREIQKERIELHISIYRIVKDIRISIWQYWNGLYREHIYENILWWVGSLRNTVQSLAEIDLSPSVYEDVLSFKGFNLERFLSTDPEIRKRDFFPYFRNSTYESQGSDVDYLKRLRLGLDRKYEFLEGENVEIPIRNSKEEYLVAFELINRIEKRAKELIEDYERT